MFNPTFEFCKRTLPNVLRYRAQSTPNEVFLEFGDRRLTFSWIAAEADRIAAGLAVRGIRAGDHVATLLPNSVEAITVWFGIARLGAVDVPVNVHLRGEGLVHQLRDCGARVLFLTEAVQAHVVSALGSDIEMDFIVVDRDDAVPPASTFAALGEGTSTALPEIESIACTDISSILYTSGTTGLPKGVMMSHHYLYHYTRGLVDLMPMKSDDRVMMVLPLYHTNPKLFVYGALISGAAVLLRESFSVSMFWDDVRRSRATVIDCLGVMPSVLSKLPEEPNERDTSVRVAYMVPCPPDMHANFTRRFGFEIFNSYGSTETNCPVHFTADCDAKKVGSAGRRWGPIDFRVVDQNDFEVPAGEVGEIVTRPSEPWTMFSGYWNRPEETVRAWRNLWFHTGDSGYVDSDGYLWFVGRIKEAIRRSGEMLSAAEVERALDSHPSIAESAVVGVPSEFGDDEVKAVVVMKPGAVLAPEDLLTFLEGKVAYFMVPRFVEFRASLPKTPSARIEKYKLIPTDPCVPVWDRVAAGYRVSRS